MLSDQIVLFVISLLVSLGAAAQARVRSDLPTPRSYWVKVWLGSVGVAAGVFVTVFVLSGFGWGWPDLSPASTRTYLVSTGAAVGLLFSVFAWLMSGAFSIALGLLLLLNVAVAVMPADNLIRVLGFAVGNYLGLSVWFARVKRR